MSIVVLRVKVFLQGFTLETRIFDENVSDKDVVLGAGTNKNLNNPACMLPTVKSQ